MNIIIWSDIFSIVKDAFGINQTGFAEAVNCSKSLINKIARGCRKCKIDKTFIYDNVFVKNAKTTVGTDSEEDLLFVLEQTIENNFKEIKNILADCWVEEGKYQDGDYQKIVMCMLAHTPKNSLSESIKSKAYDSKTGSTVKLASSSIEREENSETSLSQPESEAIVEDSTSRSEKVDAIEVVPSQPERGCFFDSSYGHSEIAAPEQHRRCAFCANWEGNANDVYKVKSGILGRCIVYHQEKFSTGGVDCEHFRPSQRRKNIYTILKQLF